MKKLFVLFLLLFIAGPILKAQPYEHAVGIRAGYASGLSYKGFFRHSLSAIEVDALYHEAGFGLNGIYMQHLTPFRSDRWLLGFGGGAFWGKWENDPSLGLVALAGMSYVIRDLPLEVGVDWRPMFNLYRNYSPVYLDFGFVLRYRFSL